MKNTHRSAAGPQRGKALRPRKAHEGRLKPLREFIWTVRDQRQDPPEIGAGLTVESLLAEQLDAFNEAVVEESKKDPARDSAAVSQDYEDLVAWEGNRVVGLFRPQSHGGPPECVMFDPLEPGPVTMRYGDMLTFQQEAEASVPANSDAFQINQTCLTLDRFRLATARMAEAFQDYNQSTDETNEQYERRGPFLTLATDDFRHAQSAVLDAFNAWRPPDGCRGMVHQGDLFIDAADVFDADQELSALDRRVLIVHLSEVVSLDALKDD
jgi:hypothetical protein